MLPVCVFLFLFFFMGGTFRLHLPFIKYLFSFENLTRRLRRWWEIAWVHPSVQRADCSDSPSCILSAPPSLIQVCKEPTVVTVLSCILLAPPSLMQALVLTFLSLATATGGHLCARRQYSNSRAFPQWLGSSPQAKEWESVEISSDFRIPLVAGFGWMFPIAFLSMLRSRILNTMWWAASQGMPCWLVPLLYHVPISLPDLSTTTSQMSCWNSKTFPRISSWQNPSPESDQTRINPGYLAVQLRP